MTCNILISWRQLWYVFLPNLKSSPDVLHLFVYGFPPKGIAILLIKCICLLNWLGDLNSKLVRSNPILWPKLSNDAVALHQKISDPPCKCRVACYAALYHIFDHLHRLRVLHILEGHPCCATILPLDEYFNPLCCISVTFCSGTRRDEHVLLLYFSTFVPMVENIL